MNLLLAAATESTDAHSNPLIPESNELFWGAISFVVLFVLLSKFVFPSLRKTLAERTEKIEGNLERAQKEFDKAQALLVEYEKKLAEAQTEAQRVVAQAHANANQLEIQLRAKAEDEARRIVERARQEIQNERDRAITELRSEVGAIAIDLASRVVGESLDSDRHMRLVDQYVADLQSSN